MTIDCVLKFSLKKVMCTLMSFLLLVACAGEKDSKKEFKQVQLEGEIPLSLDSSLSEVEMTTLKNTLTDISRFNVKAEPNGDFQKVFSSTDSRGVANYINERIKYIISDKIKLDERFKFSTRAESKGVIAAVNIGTALWFESIAEGKPIEFLIGKSSVVVKSTRIGIIQLGEAFSNKDIKIPYPELTRASVIVHEARHSDCTGGLTDLDKQLLKANRQPVNHTCGHTHVECPIGHDLEGSPACDSHPWGAYSIAAVYAKEIYRSCTGCSELDKQAALAVAADSFDRVMVLKDIEKGRAGKPDMSHKD